jgi:hypothetical protein
VTLAWNVGNVRLASNRMITDGKTGACDINLLPGNHDVMIEGNVIAQADGVGSVNAINFDSTDTRPEITDVTIRNNRIGPVHGGGDAIQAKHTRRLLVEDNEIFGITLPPGSDAHPDVLQSIYGSADMTVQRNFIHDIAAQGVFVQGFRGVNTNVTATHNVVVRVAYPWTAFIFDVANSSITHNTVDGVVRIGATTRGSDVRANIATYGLLTDGDAQVSENYNLSQRFTRVPGGGSIVGRPVFRDAARNDFALAQGSPGKGVVDGLDVGSRFPSFPAP